LKTLYAFGGLFCFIASALQADFAYKIENSNFSISQNTQTINEEQNYLYNYNRLRLQTQYKEERFFATLIADGVNYFADEYSDSPEFALLKSYSADTPLKTQSSFHDYGDGQAYAKLYRLYAGYEDAQNRVVVGLENISMGVGRIWTPTNSFNPKNIYALEPDETFGIYGVMYTRYLDETSHMSGVVSQKEDESLKYALRYKTFFAYTDLAFDFIGSDEMKMFGVELEGNLADTGIELRSEAAFIKSELQTLTGVEEQSFTQAIIGADYGFVNGFTLVLEGLYSSKTFDYDTLARNLHSEVLQNLVPSKFYTALSLSYSFTLFLDGSLTYIKGFGGEDSDFIAPLLSYTMNDYTTFSVGAILQKSDSEIVDKDEKYYLKWVFSF